MANNDKTLHKDCKVLTYGIVKIYFKTLGIPLIKETRELAAKINYTRAILI